MDPIFILAQSASEGILRGGAIWAPLFWGFLIAALIWLIAWLLFRDDRDFAGDDEDDSQSTEAGSARAVAGAGTAATGIAEGARSAAAAEAVVTPEAIAGTTGPDLESESGSPDSASAEADEETEVGGEDSGDDLTKLGIGAGLENSLNAAGISTYGEIGEWTSDDAEGFAGRFGADHPDVDFGELPWKSRALADGVDLESLPGDDPVYGPAFNAPDQVDHDAVIASSFAGEDVRNDRDLGVVYQAGADPNHRDNLQDIRGVGPKLEEELHGYGVHCFKQIANWSDHNVAEFAERMNCFKDRIERDRWIPQAASFECTDGGAGDLDTATAAEAASKFAAELESGNARQDDDLGIVYLSAPENADDLTRIKGVGAVLEKKLQDFGVYTFKQIACWTDVAAKEFDDRLAFKGRIYRDDWIAQAKALHESKYGAKV